MNSEQHNITRPVLTAQELTPEHKTYGGIRRLAYFVGIVGIAVLNAGIDSAAQGKPGIALLGYTVTLVLAIVLIVNRLHNTGMRGWWSLLVFVPIANLILAIRCLMMPEGYQDTRKLDMAAKVILGIVLGVVAVFVIVGLAALFAR